MNESITSNSLRRADKRSRLTFLLLAEFLLLFLIGVLLYKNGMTAGLMLIEEPFKSIASLLRTLSLSGSFGNVIAIILYILLSLLPLLFAGFRVLSKRRFIAEDLLLVLLCAYSFYLFYALINPATLLFLLPKEIRTAAMLPMLRCCAAVLYDSILLTWLLLSAVSSLSKGSTQISAGASRRLISHRLSLLLTGCAFLYTGLIGYNGAFSLMSSFSTAIAAQNPVLNGSILLIRYLLALLPDIGLILVLLQSGTLFSSLAKGMYQGEEAAAYRLFAISRLSVRISVLSSLTSNLLQFLLAGLLSDVRYQLNLPLLSLALSFAALVLSGYFGKAQKEHEDNELFI